MQRALSRILLHVAVSLGCAVVGSLIGSTTGLDGTITFFLPVAVLAAASGFAVRRLRPDLTAFVPWILLPTSVVFVAAVVTEGLYDWPEGIELQFIGTGYCGEYSCMGQMYATAPLIASIAYALAACAGGPVTWMDNVREGIVIGAALLAASWLALSVATQRPPVMLHLSPYRGDSLDIPADAWCRTSAAAEYVALSPPARLARATAFYDSTMAPQLRRNYFDADSYRRTFLTASLESPVVAPLVSGLSFAHREIAVHGYPRREIPRLTRDAAAIAMVGAIAVLGAWWLLRRRRVALER